MATRGVRQLARLNLYYCEVGGSSRMMREYIGNGRLADWAAAHPHVYISVNKRNGHHPFIHADYLTSTNNNIHQISVKNYESCDEIGGVMDLLSNRSGRKITKIVKDVLTDTPSVQGVWTPFLNLQHEPAFAFEYVEGEGEQRVNDSTDAAA